MLATLSSVGAGGLGGSEGEGMLLICVHHRVILHINDEISGNMCLTSAGVDVSAGRGEPSGPVGVDSCHSELVPATRPDVREPGSLL